MPDQVETGQEILKSYLTKGKSSGSGRRSLAGHGPEQGMARNALKALHVPSFKKGGKVKKTGIYKLHKGEHVMTAKQSKSHPGLDC